MSRESSGVLRENASLLGMATVALILGALVYGSMDAGPGEEMTPAQAVAGGAVFGELASNLRSIVVEAQGRTLRFERLDDGSFGEATDLVRSLLGLKQIAELSTEAVSDPALGLAPPFAVLRLHGDTETAFAVGGSNPASTGVYGRFLPDRPAIVVGSLLRWELDKLLGRAGDADHQLKERTSGS